MLGESKGREYCDPPVDASQMERTLRCGRVRGCNASQFSTFIIDDHYSDFALVNPNNAVNWHEAVERHLREIKQRVEMIGRMTRR